MTRNRNENRGRQEKGEDAREEHGFNRESEDRRTESNKVGETRSKPQTSEREEISRQSAAERLIVQERGKNDGKNPENQVRIEGGKIPKNQIAIGEESTEGEEIVIEELEKVLQNFIEKKKTKSVGQLAGSPKHQNTDYKRKNQGNFLDQAQEEHRSNEKKELSFCQGNCMENQSILGLHNNKEIEMKNADSEEYQSKPPSEEYQSKSPTIQHILIASMGKGRKMIEEGREKNREAFERERRYWRYRELKLKEQSNKGRIETHVHNSENGEWYFVELPNENNDEEDANMGRDDKTEAWEVELAQNIKARL
ncbi:uncharacterized protein DS421_10g297670 [Arachis hypogaea]|nr:uncharacterized protein DS421_10g297670 [Arachis hypogaea]